VPIMPGPSMIWASEHPMQTQMYGWPRLIRKRGLQLTLTEHIQKGLAYYQYIFVYIDDILVRSESPQEIIQVI
jgi:hypothetical protein